jgi:hypothetical protein
MPDLSARGSVKLLFLLYTYLLFLLTYLVWNLFFGKDENLNFMPLKERVFTFLLLVESSYSWARGEALACEVSVEIVQAEKG